MSKHLNQVEHNADFLRHQCEHFKNNYFDWKVICAFYVAYHAVKGLAHKKGIDIGQTHQAISRNINPACDRPAMGVTRHCWKNYRDLRILSKSARYNGFADLHDHEAQNKENLRYAFTYMNEVLKYCNSKGLEVKPIGADTTIDLIEW